MAFLSLQLPAELAGVPPVVLKDFLSQFSKLLVTQLAPQIPDQQVQAAVVELLSTLAAGSAKPLDVRLEFKHVCKFTGCHLDECPLCRNNPNKVCDDANCFDQQYWVRDDSKGGQLIKAKCGADVSLQLIDKTTNGPIYMPDVKLKLYVINGQQLASTGGGAEQPGGLYLSDDGHPLYAAAGTAPDDDKGIQIELSQDELLGPVGCIPEFQFLDKNSKFKVGGRTFKSFKLMARALKQDASGNQVVLAQVESESFKVTTKKGYDGCRKAEYLYAHDPITDKTFANLGETTISNLKSNFEGVETVEDLMQLVQACRSAPDMEARLRETLNMARDTDKWRNLIRMLSEKVVWDDSMPRMFLIPTASRPLGLLFRANKGQVDFSNPIGIILNQATASGQLRAVRLTDRLAMAASRHVEALRGLAAAYWKLGRHPGWALAPDTPVWEDATAAQVVEAFTEVLGQGDPGMLADMHLAALQQAQLAAVLAPLSGVGLNLLHTATPLSSTAVTPQPLLDPSAAVAAALQGSGLMGVAQGLDAAAAAAGGGFLGSNVAGAVTPEELIAAAAAAAGTTSGAVSSSGATGGHGATVVTAASPVAGQGGLGGAAAAAAYDGNAAESAQQSAHMSMSLGNNAMPQTMSASVMSRPAAVRPTITTTASATTASQLARNPAAAAAAAQGPSSGLGVSLPQFQAFNTQNRVVQTGQSNNVNNNVITGAGSGTLTASPFAMLAPSAMQNATPLLPQQVQGGAGAAAAAALGQLSSLQLQQQLAASAAAAASSGMVGQSLSGGQLSHLPLQQQQQQQQISAAAASNGMAVQSMSVGRPSSSGSGLSAGALDSNYGNSMQQQQQQVVPVQQQQQSSNNTLLLHQAIVEGWPASQVTAVLDQMTNDELQQLVTKEPSVAATVLARAGGDGGQQGLGQQGLGQQGLGQQGLGQQGLGQQANAVIATQPPLLQKQVPLVMQQQQQGLPVYSNVIAVPSAQAMQQQQQQQQQHQGYHSNIAAGHEPQQPLANNNNSSTAEVLLQQAQQQQQQRGSDELVHGGTAASAAAALAALFADTEAAAACGANGAAGRSSFDVSLSADQMNAAGLLNLSADSFADPTHWGDLLENLRNLSSASNGPGGVAAAAAANHPQGGSFSTEWIPDLLFRLESESKDKAAKDTAAAAAPAGADLARSAAAAAARDEDASAAAAAVADDDAAYVKGLLGRKAKRERSRTGQAPTAEQLAQLQALLSSGDPNELRSLSKGASHFGSFNRHFPVARQSSQKQEVHQGAQVSNPWNPGQPMSATGVPTSPPHSGRPAVTTQAPTLPAAAGAGPGATQGRNNTSNAVISVTGGDSGTTHPAVGAAAVVAPVSGLHEPLLSSVPEGGDIPSSELLSMLAGFNSISAANGAAAEATYLPRWAGSSLPDDSRNGNRLQTPFLTQCLADEAAEVVHAPTSQRDSSGKAGWISSLFSWSSKSNSLQGVGSGQLLGSVPSTTSKDVTAKGGS